tara:strand:- start:1330 stop:1947 length:618 start_codon:yes stop_codon:yes gene_type:complete
MPTTGNANLEDTTGGNGLRTNYTGITWGNDHGAIFYGLIHKRGDVTSDVFLQASDGEHFFSMDKDGERKGWTTTMCPGNFQVECGSNKEQDSETCMINAKNGNISIVATNGKIKLQANSIDLIACGSNSEGNVQITATETISLDGTKVIINSKVNTKLMSSGITEVIGNSCLMMYGSIIRGVTDAVAVKDSKVGGQRYQQQQNIA